jgi:hypothetical protein
MRAIAVIVIIMGIAALVFGILFVAQAGTAEKEIANSVAPLTLDQVNPKYDAVAVKYDAAKAAEEPKIQAGQAAPSAMYDYLSAQRALLGLAKSNIGLSQFIRISGVVDILMGLGVVLAGVWLMRKSFAAA